MGMPKETVKCNAFYNFPLMVYDKLHQCCNLNEQPQSLFLIIQIFQRKFKRILITLGYTFKGTIVWHYFNFLILSNNPMYLGT